MCSIRNVTNYFSRALTRSNWRERKKKGKGTGFVGNFDGFIGSIRSRVSLYVDFPFEHNSRPIDRIRVSKRTRISLIPRENTIRFFFLLLLLAFP